MAQIIKERVVKMKIIDPHLHLFALELGDYHWLKAENPPFWPDKQCINNKFDETDLMITEPLSLAGFIHIEAGFDNEQPWRELAALEHNCNKPFRAIANIDLTASSQQVSDLIEKLAEFRSFVGVRHLLDEQALSLLTNKQVLNNIKILNDNSLIFEPANIDTSAWQRWQSNLTKLSFYPNVAIKCSVWEMTDRNYNTAWLNNNLSLIFTVFGAKRVMLASNFPLCLFNHSNYQAYWQSIISSDFFQALSKYEKNALCYDNALNWYLLASTCSE